MKNILHFKYYGIFSLFIFSFWLGCEDNIEKNEQENRPKKLISFGVSSFSFDKYEPLSHKPIEVHVYLPDSVKTDLPIMFVMHGASRNAQDYCFTWVAHAREYKFITVCPDFSETMYPGSEQYNLGGMQLNGMWQDSTKWAYQYIEAIFQFLKNEKVSTVESYGLYGHSAGSQFVHRLSLFTNPKHASIIISANAGWYTTTDFDESFPYGLKDSPLTLERLKKKFELPLVILLGEDDNDPNHSSLRKTEEAMRQGQHRFERGHYFFNTAQAMADSLGVEFNWILDTVPDVGHSNMGMAPKAAKIFFDKLKD